MKRPGNPFIKRLAVLCWLLVAIFYFYLCYDYVRISMNDGRLDTYLQYVVQLAGNEDRTAKDVRALILVRADELNLPLRGDQISIFGSGRSLRITVDYDVDIILPVLKRGFYPKHYSHKATYQQAF